MTDAMLLIQSVATAVSDILLCIGATAFLLLVYLDDGI